MRIVPLFSAALAVMFCLTGCGSRDRTAEKYAEKLADVLKAYDEEVGKKIAAERTSYEKLKAAHLEAANRDVQLTIRMERHERARRLADQVIKQGEDGLLTRSEIQDGLRDYAAYEFDQRLVLLDDEMSAQETFLQNLEALEADSGKIKDLMTSLNALAKPKSRTKQLQELIEFGKKVNEQYKHLECIRIGQEIERLTKRIANTADPDTKERLQKQLKGLQDRQAECQQATIPPTQ